MALRYECGDCGELYESMDEADECCLVLVDDPVSYWEQLEIEDEVEEDGLTIT